MTAPAREANLHVVEGEVVRPDGKPLPEHHVLAFDRAVCQWRSLGVDRTNSAGRYRITYTAEQLKAWGKTRADLKVEVYAPTKGDAVPSVLLATSPLILQALTEEIVNFAIGEETYRGPDEFTRVETALSTHIGTLDDLSCLTLPDILILAREARVPNSRVAYYVKARRQAAAFDAPAEAFYGLMRRNQPVRIDALLARPLSKLWSALREANAQNIINLPLDAPLRKRLAEIQQRYLAQPQHPYARLLGTTRLTAKQQSAFTQKLMTTELSGDAFWESLASDDGFDGATVSELRDTYALQAFADDNTSLTVRLRSGLEIRRPREVATLSMEAWRDTVLVDDVEIPDEVLPGRGESERRSAYARMLYRSAEVQFPTASLSGQMSRDPVWAKAPVSAFLAAFPDFEFSSDRVTYFLQQHPKAIDVFPDAPAGRTDLLRVEQLFHLTPPVEKLSVIQPLWDAGLRSAPQIAFLGRRHLTRLAGGLDGQVMAGIHRQAVHVTSMALNVYLRYHPRLNSLSPYAVRTPRLPRDQAIARAATTLPEWKALFGSTDACECSPFASALSPAAYLVDTEAFLQRAVDASGRNALDELLERRPDLGTLQLTAANTETELPTIDLLLEILEAIAASADHKTLPDDAILPTTWDAAQLAAQPEHFEPQAYVPLREATHPFIQLPFDLWLEEARRYLGKMGIARDELMRLLPPQPKVGPVDIATEALKMSARESAVIRKPDTRIAALAGHWGVDTAEGTLLQLLGNVETFLDRAAIDHATLLRLLNTRFVNPNRAIALTFSGGACALDGATFTDPNGGLLTAAEFRGFLDRCHRFVRLQRRLGWTEYALDTTLSALDAGALDEDGFLPDLAAMRSLGGALHLSADELSGWYADLDTYLFDEALPSRYEAVFLDPGLFPDAHSATGPDLRQDVFALTADRTDLIITASTSTTLSRWLAESDGATPPGYVLHLDYSQYVQSATRLTAADMLLLVAEVLPKDAVTGNVALNLANLSLLYRIGSFVRAIGSSVADYLALKRLSGIAALAEPPATARPIDSLEFHRLFIEVGEGAWSVGQLSYLLLDVDDPLTPLAPAAEDMDLWLATIAPAFAGTVRPATVTADQKTALAQSLGTTLALDAAVLEELLFLRRPILGGNLLAHVIVAANPDLASPPAPSHDFHAVFETLHKFGIAWKGLALDPSHLAFVLDRGPAIGWTDIAALPVDAQAATDFTAWRRLTAAAELQTAVFTVEESLFGLMQAAVDGVADPSTFVPDEFLAQVSAWSRWPHADVVYLTGASGFNFALPGAMQSERPFVALRQAIDLYRRSGASAQQAHTWTVAEPTFAEAQSIKQTLTLSYQPDEWLTVLGEIQDELRSLRRDALLGYLLRTLDFEDATAFYIHYFIDPNQSPCARTSRIVEAHMAVQTFAQRILFGLEAFAFSPSDAEAWAWRKNYRLWEAARKIFLFPENWIAPELRDNKSVFFKELEDGLAQDDITLETAEGLYRDYLVKLDRVSRLEIMGMYEDTWTISGDIQANVLHVFGRTRDVPHLYYYRRREDKARWTPWEPVLLDIQGDHLTPIAFNGRLFLFWPTFKLTAIEPDVAKLQEEIDELKSTIQEYDDTIAVLEDSLADTTESIVVQTLAFQLGVMQALRDTAISDKQGKIADKNEVIAATPANDVEVTIAWSTYANGRWSSKRLATNSAGPIATNFRPKDFYFTGWVSSGNELYLALRGERIVEAEVPPVDLDDIAGGVVLSDDVMEPPPTTVETLDVGYFKFDDCQSALLFFEDANLSSSVFETLPRARSRAGRTGDRQVITFSTPVVAPDGNLHVTDSEQSFDSRKLTGAQLSLELGSAGTDVRPLLGSVGRNGKVRYAHQYGRGKELSPFFYVEDTRSYFVEPLPDAPLLTDVHQLPADAAATARLTSTPGALTSTHYQQKTTTQVIDRGLAVVSVDMGHLADLDVILTDDKAPTTVVGSTLATTGFRYEFTRFYHPFACACLKQLSRYGVEGVLNPDPDLNDESKDLYRQLTPLERFDFGTTYTPDAQWMLGFYNAETLDERFDFDADSPFGSYNWELFFHIPLLIATTLMQHQRFDDARRWFHYIFDPRHTDGEGPARFWKIKPFYQEQLSGPTETLQELIDLLENGSTRLEQQVKAWEQDPFRPDAIARLRITAYMQTTVMKYVDALVQHGDLLFLRDTREYVNEAMGLYLLASEILGEQPTLLPAEESSTLTPNLVLGRFDLLLGGGLAHDPLDFLASLLPTTLSGVASGRSQFRSAGSVVVDSTIIDTGIDIPTTTTTTSGQGGTDTFNTLLLFCLPHNDVLEGYWATVADRIFKVRHCMNLSGQVRQLALFAPPIDPALLVRAVASGLDIQQIVSSLYGPLPHYRFSTMLQKAIELCGDVRNFGASLLAALQNHDGEELSRLRNTHERALLTSVRLMKQKAVEEADGALAALLKSKTAAEFRVAYYSTQERVSSGEQKSLDSLADSRDSQKIAEAAEQRANSNSIIPNVSITTGVTPSVSVSFGGSNLGAADQAIAGYFRSEANALSYEGTRSGTMAGYDRRLKDWKFQGDLAKKEVDQLDKQILTAEIRKQVAETDLANHDEQIARAAEVDEFLKLKFTNQELFAWMLSRVSGVYFQLYQLAYQTAKQAEMAYRHELGPENAADTFIGETNWDSLRKGLLAGELLLLDLRRMEKAHLDANRRELEITKPVSLFQIDPRQLLQLRQTGACDIHIPEAAFNLDFPSHYFRRIKTVRLTIPGVTGPYTSVSATLRLMRSWTRREVPDDVSLPPEQDVTVLPQTAIATCNGNADSGMFELNFNDPRYLAFEGGGAVSTWRLELPTSLRPFDYASIADVVLHVSYTARDGGAPFGDQVKANLLAALNDWTPLVASGVTQSRLLSLRRDFPAEWHALAYAPEGQAQRATLTLGKQHFPRMLDYLWTGNGSGLAAAPISISFAGAPAQPILDPIGPPPAEEESPRIVVTGLSDISNDAAASVTVSVGSGMLDPNRWRDLYLLLRYEVVA